MDADHFAVGEKPGKDLERAGVLRVVERGDKTSPLAI